MQRGCRVHALHVHHGLRGTQADRDAAYCASICEEWNVPLRTLHYDVPHMAAEAGLSFEHMGRELRCAALRALALDLADNDKQSELAPIALAHHADDQTETLLFHLCRGAAGLRPMLPLREEDGLRYLRPILHWRRSEITDYLSTRGIRWCDDETNDEDDATRNALRHHIIPQLSTLMGRDIVPIVNRSAEVQHENESALRAALSQLPSRDPQGRLYLPYLREQIPSLQRAILFSYLREQGVSDVSERLVQEALSLISGDRHVLNLAAGARLRRRQGRIYVELPC